MSILCYLGKASMVADTLSRFSVGSTIHMEKEKKDLAKEVHRLAQLGVQLDESSEGGILVHNRSISLFIVKVKDKKDLDPILLQLKDDVHK